MHGGGWVGEEGEDKVQHGLTVTEGVCIAGGGESSTLSGEFVLLAVSAAQLSSLDLFGVHLECFILSALYCLVRRTSRSRRFSLLYRGGE